MLMHALGSLHNAMQFLLPAIRVKPSALFSNISTDLGMLLMYGALPAYFLVRDTIEQPNKEIQLMCSINLICRLLLRTNRP